MFKIFQYGFLGLVMGFGSVLAQDSAADTNRPFDLQRASDVRESRALVDSLLDASWEIRNTDIEKANQFAQHALEKAQKLGYSAGVARSHYLLGVTEQRVGAHEGAMKHFLQSLEMEQERGDKERIGKVLNGIAILYYRQEDFEASVNYFNQAVAILREIGNDERVAISTANIGLIHFNRGEYQKALDKYNKALAIFKSKSDNKLAVYVTISNIGNVFTELGQYQQAEDHHMEALQYFENNDLIRNQSEVLLSLSKLHYSRDRDVDQAIAYADKSLQKAKSINFKESIVAAYKQLADLYEDEENYDEALSVYKQFKATQDSIVNSERAAKIEEMETRFNLREKNRQIELLNKEADLQQARLSRQKLWRSLLIIILVLLAVIVGLLYRYNNQKAKANTLLEEKNRQIEEKNNKLTHLNEEKNEFMGMAAHDLRNPLSGIKSVISMVRYEDTISEEEIRDYLEIIDHSSDRMLILINNLLDVNAIEEGGRPLDIQTVQVNSIIREAVQSQQRSADSKNIGIQAMLPEDTPVVKANPEALQRALENLVSNAIKYSPSGSLVEVCTSRAVDALEIMVKDNGPGIPQNEQSQLFTRFCQISTQPTANESSTGLGLFVVKSLMEKMDGSVRYNDTDDGASFILTLPLAAAEEVTKGSSMA